MITSEPTNEMLLQWKAIYEQYKNELTPNRISGEELLFYLQSNYNLVEIFDENALNVVTGNILLNDIYKERLPYNVMPNPRCFYIDSFFVGIDLVTGFFTVEGSASLFDELTAVRGIDEKDLENFVITAQYVQAIIKRGEE